MKDFINVKSRLTSYLTNSDDYLIFDRCHVYSIKSTQDGRETGITKKQLNQTTKLPAQKVVLSSVENKKQLTVSYSMNSPDKLFHQSAQRYKLVVTGEDLCPVKGSMEEQRSRFHLETQHEEANIIIIHQVLHFAEQARQLAVISDETDIFYCNYFTTKWQRCKYQGLWNLQARKGQHHIKATVAMHQKTMKNLLPAHAISGCDTVSCYSEGAK